MRSPAVLAGALLAGLSLTAQTEPTRAPAAATPHVLIDTVGPDGWRSRFGPTNLGSMLESEQGRELWEPALAPYFAIWQELAGDDAGYSASRTRLLGYGGRIRMGLWFDSDRMRRASEPAAGIAVVLDGDGRADLDAIAADLRSMLYESVAGDWQTLDLDGEKLEVRVGSEMHVAAPIRTGDRLLLAASSEGDLGLALGRARALAAAATPELRPDSPAMRVQIDFAALLTAAIASEPERDRQLMRALGLDSVGTGTLTITTAGPRVQVEYAQQFTKAERGIFAALLPATSTIPSLLLAAGEGSWTAGHFDCHQLYETVMNALAASDPDADPRAEVREKAGLDPATDLFAHMTDEVLFWLPEDEDFGEELTRTPWTATFRLRDEEAFEQGLFALLPRVRPFLQRERESEFEDVKLFRYGNMLGYDLWLAVGRGVFTIGGGYDVETRIGEVLDRCKSLPAELPAERSLPEGFGPLRRFLPPGCHGYALGSATDVVALPTELWLELLGEFVPIVGAGGVGDPDAAADLREQRRALLRQHGLDVARTATGYADATWRLRFFW